MSTMYKKARSLGYSKTRAYSTVGLAKTLSKQTRTGKQSLLKKKHPHLDFDGDRVVNKYDCQPRNKWKQDDESEHPDWTNDWKALEKHGLSHEGAEKIMNRNTFPEKAKYAAISLRDIQDFHNPYKDKITKILAAEGLTGSGYINKEMKEKAEKYLDRHKKHVAKIRTGHL